MGLLQIQLLGAEISVSLMEGNNEYFVIEDLGTIKGYCTELISKQQTQWRILDQYQQPPFKKVAKYMRNVEYCEQNVRKFEVLKQALSYLMSTFLPKLLLQTLTQKQRYSISIFLQQRLKAIRCEMFVQGIIAPRQLLKIIHSNIIIQISKQTEQIRNQLIGLEYLIDETKQQIMRQKFYKEYYEALQIAVLTISKIELQGLILRNQVILEDEGLMRLVRLRLEIERSNYQYLFRSFSREKPLLQCLLWRKIPSMKAPFIKMVKKSYLQVSSNWLYPRLGLKQPQLQVYIKVKQQNLQQLKGKKQGLSLWADTSLISQWIIN